MQQPTKTILVVGVLVVLGAFAFYFLTHHSGSPASSSPGTYYSGGSQSSVTVPGGSTGSQATTTPRAPVDIESAYAALFPQILATPMSFQPVTASSTGDFKTIFSLYASDVAAEQKKDPRQSSIDIALVDLTDDGIAEAVAYENLLDYCGPPGCPLDIYQKKSGKWTKIYTNQVGSEIGLSNVLTNGYLDLFITAGGAPTVDRYTWDGSKYKFKETMAVWTGTGFVVRQ